MGIWQCRQGSESSGTLPTRAGFSGGRGRAGATVSSSRMISWTSRVSEFDRCAAFDGPLEDFTGGAGARGGERRGVIGTTAPWAFVVGTAGNFAFGVAGTLVVGASGNFAVEATGTFGAGAAETFTTGRGGRLTAADCSDDLAALPS
ncbi:MAG: hypothetical protein L3J96_05055 [Thermoplasmata archaeon]|nr:hypothetical protein [Thermoplasmata archaeon]